MTGDRAPSRDYGVRLGPFWWRYDLTRGAAFIRNVQNQTLRYYGITVPGTNIGIGLIWRRRDT